jgi:hypothetical protein
VKSEGATNSVGVIDQGFVGHAVAQIRAAALSGLVSHNRVVLSLLAVAKGVPVRAEDRRYHAVGVAGEGGQQAGMRHRREIPRLCWA